MTQAKAAPTAKSGTRRQKIARKNIGIAMFLGFLFGPLGYIYVRAWKPAALNIVTLNYFLFGIVLVPVHAAIIIRAARNDLRQAERTRTDQRAARKIDLKSPAE